MIDEEAQFLVVQTHLNAALAPKKALDVDEVKKRKQAGTLPTEYLELGLMRRFGGEPRNGAYSGTTGWRLTTRYVAVTETNARTLRKNTTVALENAVLDFGDDDKSTPVQFETAEQIGEDEAWYSGLDTWTYTV